MKPPNNRLKKIILISFGAIILAIVIIIALISPIAKYVIEKYDVKWTGRQITLGWVYANPFTGYIHISKLKVYESADTSALKEPDSLFLSAEGLSASFSMFKLISKTVEISNIILDHPKGIVIQREKILNFTDIIKKFTPAKEDTIPSKFHFSILGIKIIDGEFHYHETIIPIIYHVETFNLVSPGKRWDTDTISAHISLVPGRGDGNIQCDVTINLKRLDYRLALIAHKFDLNIVAQYLKDLTNDGSFSANLDADLKTRGNFKDEEDMTATGKIAVNDFHFGKEAGSDFASFDKLT
ncbi:MAG: DUF748 domain-containing protein, partial [Bacteroidota bacterium]